MKKLIVVLLLFSLTAAAPGPAAVALAHCCREINPNSYYGITVANGMVGLVSSPELMNVSDVMLNGVYDHYQGSGFPNNA